MNPDDIFKPKDSDLDQPIAISYIIGALTAAKEQGITKTAQYRLFLKLKEEPTSYPNNVVAAAIISKGFTGIPDDVKDVDLDKVAKLAVGLFNDTYEAILKDLGNEEITNQVFQEIVKVAK